MAQESADAPAARRAVYIDAAIKLRDLAAEAQSSEAEQAFMRLAVLYEELADYAAPPISLPPPIDVLKLTR